MRRAALAGLAFLIGCGSPRANIGRNPEVQAQVVLEMRSPRLKTWLMDTDGVPETIEEVVRYYGPQGPGNAPGPYIVLRNSPQNTLYIHAGEPTAFVGALQQREMLPREQAYFNEVARQER